MTGYPLAITIVVPFVGTVFAIVLGIVKTRKPHVQQKVCRDELTRLWGVVNSEKAQREGLTVVVAVFEEKLGGIERDLKTIKDFLLKGK